MIKMSRQKLNILRTKRRFKMKSKAFFIIFEGLSLKQTKKNFLEDESPTLIIIIAYTGSIKKRSLTIAFP